MIKLIKNLYELLRHKHSREWRLIKREFRFYWQRKRMGYDVSDTWALFLTISEFVLPRLRTFKELTLHSYPGRDEVDTSEKWDEILDKMILAFESIIINEERGDWDNMQEIEEGLDLFRKYFFDLWV